MYSTKTDFKIFYRSWWLWDVSWQWCLEEWCLIYLNTGRSSRSKPHRYILNPKLGVLLLQFLIYTIRRASPSTSAWRYCWLTPSVSSSGLASTLKPLFLFRFIFTSSSVWRKFQNNYLFSECAHEFGNVRSHPPLCLHQQQGKSFISSRPSISWLSSPCYFGRTLVSFLSRIGP